MIHLSAGIAVVGFRQYLVQANRGFSISCSKKKFESVEPYEPGSDHYKLSGVPDVLDRWQYALSEMEGKTYGKNNHGIPVLHTKKWQGCSWVNPWEIGLQVHQVRAEPLLDKIGIHLRCFAEI
ncbi:MAG: hypothetical protein U0Z17_09565 [Bacteroidales bacterium]